MKNKILTNLIIVTFYSLTALTVYAKDKDEIVLEDGRVLKNPYIISKNPAGLNIGHKSGVIFIPFSEMSKERQKQFDYNPKEAQKYKKRIAQAQRKRQIRIEKEEKQEKTVDTGSFSYGPESFPEQSAKTALENELTSLLQEKARLKKEYSMVSSGRVLPRSGPSDDVYMSYRGGKVYRKKKKNYGREQTKNSLDKRKRLKEINAELQKNIRRTTTVRNLISRQKTKGIKKGKTVEY